MFKRYVIASLAGMLFGMILLLSKGVLIGSPGYRWDWGIWNTSEVWQVPDANDLNLFGSSSEFLALRDRALLLRTCNLFMQHGFTYLSLPALALCILVKLSDIGNKYRIVKCILRTLWVMVWSTVFVVTVGFGSAVTCVPLFRNQQEIVHDCISGVSVALWSWLWLSVPVATACFLGMLNQEFDYIARILNYIANTCSNTIQRLRYHSWCP